jgi:ribosomal protein L11 methyltransferase
MQKPTFSLCIESNQKIGDLVISLLNQPELLGCEENGTPEKLLLTAHYKTEKAAKEAGDSIRTLVPDQNLTITRVEPQDWIAQWRKSMKPARIARGYYVSPHWLPPPKAAHSWIKIEPKMAFGTGHHETTRLAAQAIISLKPNISGRRVLDIGTGSGVLCFVADLCGSAYTLGLEIDNDCRENIAENLRNNKPHGRIQFCIGSTDALDRATTFALVVMNMLMTESVPRISPVAALLKPNGRLIWSGLLMTEKKDAIAVARSHRLHLTAEKQENEWWCGIFIFKPAGFKRARKSEAESFSKHTEKGSFKL